MGAGLARLLATAAAGVALTAGCAAGPAGPAPTAVRDSRPGATPATARDQGPGAAPGAAGVGTAGTPALGPVAVRDAGLEAGVPPPAIPPVRLLYARLGIDMPVDAVGVAAGGAMEIPPDAARAGWYRYGPSVGQRAGTAVVASHAGSVLTPRGPFYDLRGAAVGDRVRAVREDGGTAAYEVVDVQRLSKATIDLSVYFRRDGDPRLVLVTCGGRWIEARRSYEDNIVVTAILVGT
ncbi:class F sortase [Georgenia sp. SYP-B2076]|uniref:class F sortase n=1 Tax=Georgenia sp. SYP-B2076 TaxID=2495881 RepID=UPI000F8D3D75|nr:class F sortase [Georgenia sp. SYP-B2076]